MKAWKQVNQKDLPGTYGLRKKKEGDPTITEPVETVPNLVLYGNLLCAKDTGGVLKQQGVWYPIYKYKKTPDVVCTVAGNEHGYSKYQVTFSKEADWNDFETTIFVDQEHRFCEPDPGGGDS
jgi:hypothetical protein